MTRRNKQIKQREKLNMINIVNHSNGSIDDDDDDEEVIVKVLFDIEQPK